MPDFMTLFDSDFLGAWDLTDETGKGRDYKVTIVKVEGVKLRKAGGKESRQPVLTMRGAKKRLILNRTNAKSVADMYGRDVRGWVGKMITIYPTTTDAFGKTVPCLRIRPTVPKGSGDIIPERQVDPEMREKQDAAFGREQGGTGREPGEEG